MASTPRFSLREIILLTTIVALALALWITIAKVPQPNVPGTFVGGSPTQTIAGPLVVSYREQVDPSMTSIQNSVPMVQLHFVEGAVIFEYEGQRCHRVESSRLLELSWRPAP
jgi:hypothetical protein